MKTGAGTEARAEARSGTGAEANRRVSAFRRGVETAFELVYPRSCWICGELIVASSASGAWGGKGVWDGFRAWGGKGVWDGFCVWGGKSVWDGFRVWDGKSVWDGFRAWGGKSVWDGFRVWGGKSVWDGFRVWGGKGVSRGFRVPLDALVCEECRRAASVSARTFCRRCGRVAIRETARGENALCRFCLRKTGARKFAFDEARPMHFYRGTTRALVLQLKRTNDPTLAEIAARLYFESRRRVLKAFRPDAVVPVPMNWRRRVLRSVNAPDFLAAALARELGVPCWAKTIRRVRATAPQSAVDWEARRDNVAGAFALKTKRADVPLDRLKGKRILLVDDALTSGATANEIASLLKESAEVEAVCVATLARAGLGKGRL